MSRARSRTFYTASLLRASHATVLEGKVSPLAGGIEDSALRTLAALAKSAACGVAKEGIVPDPHTDRPATDESSPVLPTPTVDEDASSSGTPPQVICLSTQFPIYLC